MAIRFVDKIARVARINATFAPMTADIEGTFVAPANRTGAIAVQFAALSAQLVGSFTPIQSRTGQINASFGALAAQLQGTSFASVPAPQNVRILLQGQTAANTTASPPAPTNGNTETVGWDSVVGTSPTYELQVSTDAVNWTSLATGLTATQYQNNAATNCVNGTQGSGSVVYPGTRRYYRVRATVGGFTGAFSTGMKFMLYANGTRYGWGGDFNNGVTANYADTTGSPKGGVGDIKVTLTTPFGEFLPYTGNTATQWNLGGSPYNYLCLDIKSTVSGQDFKTYWFHRISGGSGDDHMYDATHASYNRLLSAYGTLVPNAWVSLRVPVADILTDFGPPAAPFPNSVIQTAVYKGAIQDPSGNLNSFYLDNLFFYWDGTAPASSGFTPSAGFSVTPATTFAHSKVVTINRAVGTFPLHADYNPSGFLWLGNRYRCALAKSFEDGTYTGNGLSYNTGGAVWDVVDSSVTAPPVNLTKCARWRGQTSRQGELQFTPSVSPDYEYVSFDFKYGASFDGKIWRSWSQGTESLYLATTLSSKQLTGSNTEAQDVFGSPDSFTLGWNHVECFTKLKAPSPTFVAILNTKTEWTRPWPPSPPMNLGGHTQEIGNLLEIGNTGYYADYFMDFDSYIVFLTDAPTLAASTRREFQVPVGTQTTGARDYAINQGEHASTSGKHLIGYDFATAVEEHFGQIQ